MTTLLPSRSRKQSRKATENCDFLGGALRNRIRRGIGRDDLVEFSQYTWVIVQGCAGSGKTSLAIEWVTYVGKPAVFLASSKSGEEKLRAMLGRLTSASVLLVDEAKQADIDGKYVVVHDCHRAPEALDGIFDGATPAHVMLLTEDAEAPSLSRHAPPDSAVLVRELHYSYTVASGILPLANVLAANLAAVHYGGTERPGPLPLVIDFDEPEALAGYVADEIRELLRDGVAPHEIAVICGSRAESRQMSSRLLGNRVAASPLSRLIYARELKLVLWLTRLATQLRSGARLGAVDRRNRDVLIQRLGLARWEKLLREIRTMKVTSLESTYCHCCEAYLRIRGGVRAHRNQRLRSYLMVWEPVARTSESIAELLHLSRSMQPVRCLTPQAARGGAWKYVFVAGLTHGVWTIGPDTQVCLLQRLLLDTITRCTRELRILISPPETSSGVAVLSRIAGSGFSSEMCSSGSMRD